MGYNKFVFLYLFKSALKKIFSPKNNFSETYLIFQLAKQFLKQIFGMHFY